MASFPDELLTLLAKSRADAAIVVLGALAASLWCRHHLHCRQAANQLGRIACPGVVGLAIGAALLAEYAGGIVGYPASAKIGQLVAARVIVLGGASLLGGVLLIAVTRVALLRAAVQSHAETQSQLELARAAADEANRAKSDFLAVMSHEIRTPLNAVMGFAKLLAETRLDDAQRGYVATITSEGARLTSLMTDLLDFTKIEEGRLVLERLPFAPVETAGEVLRLLSARAHEKQLDLRFEPQLAAPLLVAGDPMRFRQVLINLVDNAVKFTAQGSVTLFVDWTPPANGATHGTLNVSVTDTGIGIAPEKLKDLFQMFMQADASTTRRFGGTGLGLAISQRLVRLMGGNIAVRSTPGVGSTFSFALALPPVSLPADSSGEPAEPAEASEASSLPPRILVVDDLETNRFLLEVFLHRHGYTADFAAGGAEAVRRAGRNAYDAILMDLQMPDIDGYAATKQIRANEPAGRRTPIIALTASITRGTREKCLAAGMDEYLTKPLDLRKFRMVLKDHIAAPAPSPV